MCQQRSLRQAAPPGGNRRALTRQRSKTAGNPGNVRAITPPARPGTAPATAYLATPEAAFITGETVHVNGGLRMY